MEAARGKTLQIQGNPIRVSAETWEAQRECNDAFKRLKEKNCKTKIQYMAELPVKEEEEIKTLSNK